MTPGRNASTPVECQRYAPSIEITETIDWPACRDPARRAPRTDERDPRGFAIRFYTEEGNWDLVGNNTPMFFIRDPIKFPDFVHTQKRDPQTHLKSAQMMWDFWSKAPESLHQVTMLFSDRGTPDGYRHMDGFGSHTFSLINAAGS